MSITEPQAKQAKQPQRVVALALANETRMAIARFKLDLSMLTREGAARRVADVLTGAAGDPLLAASRVRPVLLCIPGWGERKTTQCLVAAGVVSGDKRVRELSDRQRRALAEKLLTWSGR